jgi:hypothetical protein
VGDWHPIEVMIEHYSALDRLELSAAEIFAMGRDVTNVAQGNVFVMAARAAASTLEAWTILAQFQTSFWRFVRGGGLAIYKLGPKEARLELVKFPVLRSRYCQIATRGVINNALELFCKRVYVNEIPALCTDDELVARISWV